MSSAPSVRPWIVLAAFAGVVALVSLAVWVNAFPKVPMRLGVTFSQLYASSFGVDWKEAFRATLDDLGVRDFRLSAYWSEIEPSQGEYRFDDLDWMLSEAEARGAVVTLAIGRKLPRWPECYIPDWAEGMDQGDANDALIRVMRTTVERYRDREVIVRWQVENEAFFPFGVCPPPDADLFAREIELVRSLDDRPIMLTVSGELDPWIDVAKPADVLGISAYRVTWNALYGFFYYPIGPSYYRLRAEAIEPYVDDVIVSELQAEPWFRSSPSEMSGEERVSAFTPRDFKNTVEFVRHTGLSEALLWGVEWWYAEKERGEPGLWEEARVIFK